MAEKYRLQYKTHFDAAHQLKDYDGKCNREHGHRWDVEIVIEGSSLDKRNMLIDFTDVKAMMKEVIDGTLDHFQLNETLNERNPTAEFLSQWLFNQIEPRILAYKNIHPDAAGDMHLSRCCVWESPEACVKFYRV
jgi:6-pyruvoyltetrahydropterin/6-carboxytetrahydropterin synthase